jgi:hypothetical protein
LWTLDVLVVPKILPGNCESDCDEYIDRTL